VINSTKLKFSPFYLPAWMCLQVHLSCLPFCPLNWLQFCLLNFSDSFFKKPIFVKRIPLRIDNNDPISDENWKYFMLLCTKNPRRSGRKIFTGFLLLNYSLLNTYHLLSHESANTIWILKQFTSGIHLTKQTFLLRYESTILYFFHFCFDTT